MKRYLGIYYIWITSQYQQHDRFWTEALNDDDEYIISPWRWYIYESNSFCFDAATVMDFDDNGNIIACWEQEPYWFWPWKLKIIKEHEPIIDDWLK